MSNSSPEVSQYLLKMWDSLECKRNLLTVIFNKQTYLGLFVKYQDQKKLIFLLSVQSLPPNMLSIEFLYSRNICYKYMQQPQARPSVWFRYKMWNKLDRLCNIHFQYHVELVTSQRFLLAQGALMQCSQLCCLRSTTDLTLVTVYKRLRDSPNSELQLIWVSQAEGFPSSWKLYR